MPTRRWLLVLPLAFCSLIFAQQTPQQTPQQSPQQPSQQTLQQTPQQPKPPVSSPGASSSPDSLNTHLTAEQRAHDLVSRMTLAEKASQLEDWAMAIPRLGIPDYQTWNEALHGVAYDGYATVFPQAIGNAATWDPTLLHEIGKVISLEARAKYNQAQRHGNHRIFFGLTFWSPNINIFRDPRWGRGQETYGEDPFLTGKLGSAFITGIQGDDPAHPRAIATSKHFAVHSGPEPLRHGFNVNPSPRDLEETYLPAFRTTVIDAHVGSIMCAYNAIDQSPACTNKQLLKDHLRDSWGFKGFVVSDCGAIVDINEGHKKTSDIMHSAVLSLEAGTDLSCSIWAAGFNTLAEAVAQGLTSEAAVTQATERLYSARFRLGLFDPLGASEFDRIPESEIASALSRSVALKAGEESLVLLKNSGVLPLKQTMARIAVVGPTADLLIDLEGNYKGTPVHPVTPLEGMKNQFGARSILYAQGSGMANGLGVTVPRTAFGAGLKTDFFATPDWTGRPVATLTEALIQDDWQNAFPVPEVATSNYSVRWTGSFTVPAAGHYILSLDPAHSHPYSPVETYRLKLDGKLISEGSLRSPANIALIGNFKSGPGASPTAPPIQQSPQSAVIPIDFADTKPHEICVEYSHSADMFGGGLTLKWQAPAQGLLDEAISRAKESDAVVAFIGLSPDLEGEEMKIKIDGFDGGDRTRIDLPEPQQKLLEAMGATGKPLIVVLQSGSAVALNWANEHASAIIAAWYPGVEGGTAIARTLAGLSNPGGRLPVTFYAGLDGLPAFTDYSMKGRTYRYFTGKPLWGFGYGLSYSTFNYDAVKLSATSVKAGDPLTATVRVTNTGTMAGDEVVEAYLKTPQPDGPIHSLVAFQRVHINAKESREVKLTVDPRALSSVDEEGNRKILAGKYTLSVGGAQPQEAASKAEAEFTITGSVPLPK